MNWIIARSLASAFIILLFCAQVCALDGITRPAFQGAAAVRPASGGSGSGGSGTPGFDIDIVYTGVPTPGEAAAFSAAEAAWESIITGYQITDIFSTTVTINAILQPIDGPGNVLGSAGPTHAKLNAAQTDVTPTFLYTEQGIMRFDTADTATLIGLNLFDEVILHEMGHVLGIGILWSASSVGPFPGRQEHYISGSGQYTGPAGLAAYNAEFGQASAFVPIELAGGPGTANGHWNENNGGAGLTGITSNIEPPPFNDMTNELMTGWLNLPSAFLSSLTSQSMIDLGYNVAPEPSTLLLGSFGLLFFVRWRRG
jgi:hypothetical protein